MSDRQTDAERKRLERDRKKNGKIVVPIEVDEAALIDVLVEAGYLHPNTADQREQIKVAIEKLLAAVVALDADCHA